MVISVLLARQSAYNYLVKEEYEKSVYCIIKALKKSNFARTDCANIGFVLFNYLEKINLPAVYRELQKIGLDDVTTIDAEFLRLSLSIELETHGYDKKIREVFLNQILHPNVKYWPKRPILFWHIPKCSGTSFNKYMGSIFYSKSMKDLLPGYNYLPLLSYLNRNYITEIPYLSSNHLSLEYFNNSENSYSLTILRDPLKRCLSMYRQEMGAVQTSFPRRLKRLYKNLDPSSKTHSLTSCWYHYDVLPRYGGFWDYKKDVSFQSWMDNIPTWLLLRQLSTFSYDLSVTNALNNLNRFNYILGRDNLFGTEEGLFKDLGLPYTKECLPNSLNSSSKTRNIPAQGEEQLKTLLEPEYKMLSTLHDSVCSSKN